MSFDGCVEWFQTHRTILGSLFLGLATVIGGAGVEYRSDDLVHAAAVVALVGTALSAAGGTKSDEYHREKIALLKTKIDRRSSDSLIPVRDLQKLMATDKPTNGEKE